jgi:hypothetical protein
MDILHTRYMYTCIYAHSLSIHTYIQRKYTCIHTCNHIYSYMCIYMWYVFVYTHSYIFKENMMFHLSSNSPSSSMLCSYPKHNQVSLENLYWGIRHLKKNV